MCVFEEAALESAFCDESIRDDHRKNILAYLRILWLRDEPTYLHSIRVGLLAQQIAFVANFPDITPKMLLWAGLLHDIGKVLIPPEVLTKKGVFTQEDFLAMEPHVIYGWDMLLNVHDYTANIIVRHHQFGSRPYPKVLPPLPEHLNGKSIMVHEAARLLALADYYDAMMNRNNDRWGFVPLTGQQKQELYIRDNADKTVLIKELIQMEVLKF